jgi:Right handed beta helix region
VRQPARHLRADAPSTRRRPRALTALLLLAGLVGALTVSARAFQSFDASGQPELIPRAAWLGARVQPAGSSKSAQQQAILELESRIGRRLAIDHTYVPVGQQLGWRPAWDVQLGRIPLITIGDGASTTEIAQGRHDVYLRQLAEAIRQLGKPVYLRYAPGMDAGINRAWVGSPEQFVAAWRHVHEIFDGLPAALVWTATAGAFADGTADRFYPGDEQVDWIAADGYNNPGCRVGRDGWRELSEIFGAFHAWGSGHGKPLMIAETGTVEDPADAGRKAAWFDNAATHLAVEMPNVQAVVYHDVRKPCDYQTSSSTRSFEGFKRLAQDPHFQSAPLAASSTSVTTTSTTASTPATTQSTTTTTIAAAPASYPCSGVDVAPGANVQALLDANPEETAFCLAPGTYRLSSHLRPKRGQKLIGAPGAVLNGSKVVTGFQFTGSAYVATGFLPSSPSTGPGSCWKGVQGCTYNQDVFVDDQPLKRVLSLANLTSGTFYEDFGANKIYLADNPSGSLVEQAYAPGLIESSQANVAVKGLVVEKAANQGQSAAIRLWATGSVVEGNEIRLNHGVGVAVYGATIRNNKIHHNGQMGMGAQGPNVLIEGNEVAYNNHAGYSWWWEAGGSKFCFTSDMVVRDNYVHHNRGPGLWTDIDNIRTVYENNRVTDNAASGIAHEISYDAVIRNNVLERSTDTGWGGQISVHASPNVQIYGNLMKGPHGVVLSQSNRGAGKYGPYELKNITVHDNTFTSDTSTGVFAAGLVKDVSEDSYFTSRNIGFRGNTYHLPSLGGGHFRWWDRTVTASEWRSAGQDTDGTFDTDDLAQ